MHGAGPARNFKDANVNNKGTLKAPYTEALNADYVLSCMDCHESHGSPNAFLLRGEVNGIAVGGVITSNNANGNWKVFCGACHTVNAVATGTPCGNTTQHSNYGVGFGGDCSVCHIHNGTVCGPGPDTF
jgi:predicted CXXCH cytochrome family protein